MTEAEWLACEQPQQMLDAIQDIATEGKLLPFAIACCRAIRADTPVWGGAILDAAERYIDGTAEADDITCDSCGFDFSVCPDWEASPALPIAQYFEIVAIGYSPSVLAHIKSAANFASWFGFGTFGLYTDGYETEVKRRLREQATLLRDIFGNPFRPVTFAPEWRTDTAVVLARQMYDSRDFSAMPILADALQDAGCDSEELLAHCRDPKATHVRGCWVVDLVLGKE